MKKLLLYVMPFLFLVGCGWFKTERVIPEGLLVINVLDENTFKDAHIKGSLNIPLDEIKDFAEKMTDKDRSIVVYCASPTCPASLKAWEILRDHGFTNIFEYMGGMSDWYQAGLPTEGAAQLPYLQKEEKAPEKHEGVVYIEKEELKELMQKEGLL